MDPLRGDPGKEKHMPYIHTQTNVSLTPETERLLTQDLGRAVECLGKSERWLMLRFEDRCRMAFGGDAREPVCFVGISLFGECAPERTAEMTREVTRLLNERLNVPPERIYVRYLSCGTWGWNGGNF